jgi:hypothetical protein
VSDLSTFQTAACGVGGAALWLVLVHGIPVSWRALHGDISWEPELQHILGLVGLLASYLILGGVAPFIMDAQHVKEAIGYGLGWQGVFGQFAKPSSPE